MTTALPDAPPATPPTGDRQHTSSPRWRVAREVARVEGARLVRHPATLGALALSTVLVVIGLAPRLPVLPREAAVLGFAAMPVAAGTLVAAQLAASRLERDDVIDLSRTSPTVRATRTGGLLAALLWPAAASTLWAVGTLVALRLAGGVGAPHWGDVLAPAGVVILFGAGGVALGRWARSALAGLLVLPLIAIGLYVAFAATYASVSQRLLPWGDWFGLGAMIELWPRAPGLHLLYVLLAAGVFAAVALLRDGVLRVSVVGLACGIGVVVMAVHLGGVWDDPAEVAALEADLRDPSHRLACESRQGVAVCRPPGYEVWDGRLRVMVADALSVVPASDHPPVLRVDLTPSAHEVAEVAGTLPAEVVAALPAALREDLAEPFHVPPVAQYVPETGVVPVGSVQYRGRQGAEQRLDVALGVLAEATGFRDTVQARAEAFDGDGQEPLGGRHGEVLGVEDGCAPPLEAREILTFALAAHSSQAAHQALARELEARPYGWSELSIGLFDDWFGLRHGQVTGWPVAFIGSRGVWSRGAATLGLAVADATEVADLHADWERWTDPSTPADELLAAYELPSLPTPAESFPGTEAARSGMELDFHPDCR